MEEINSILSNELKARDMIVPNFIDKLEESVKEEFAGPAEEFVDREKVKEDLEKEKAELIRKLNKCRNVRNCRAKIANTKISEKRRKLRVQIGEIDLKLEDLKIEEEGFKKMRDGSAAKEVQKTTMKNILEQEPSFDL